MKSSSLKITEKLQPLKFERIGSVYLLDHDRWEERLNFVYDQNGVFILNVMMTESTKGTLIVSKS